MGMLLLGPLVGVVVSLLPDRRVVRRAKRAREDFRMGLSAFADLASLYIATGVGPMQALESSAELGDSWVFARLAEELRRAEFAQSSAWDALRRVGDELEVPMLSDVADILRLSAENSVTIGASLQTRAHSMRHQLLTEEHERANAASERLSAPVSGLVFVFLGMLVTPAILSLLP
jgi:Flp pilus assembly protein TadB